MEGVAVRRDRRRPNSAVSVGQIGRIRDPARAASKSLGVGLVHVGNRQGDRAHAVPVAGMVARDLRIGVKRSGYD